MTILRTDKPIRIGVFETVAEADRALRTLQEAGFSKDQLGVLCSEKYKKRFFPDMPEPAPAGTHAPGAVVTGGAIGATLGGLALAASAIATGGASLLVAGPVLVGGGAIAGTFAGLMSTFGFENEKADYYEQAVQDGKILVTAEVKGEGNAAKLAEAERILNAAGAIRVGKVND